jgi:hypothetical protein
MSDRASNITFGSAGLATVVLILAGTALYPNAQVDGPTSGLTSAYIAHLGSLATSIDLQVLTKIPFVVFAAGLWRRLDRAGHHELATAFLIGAAMTVSVLAVWQASIGAAGLVGRYDSSADLRPAAALVNALDQMATMPIAILMGAASLAMVRGSIGTRWLGWLGLVGAGMGVIGVFAMTDMNSVIGKANPIALLLFLIWMAGLSVVSLVSARSSAGGGVRTPEAASSRS